MYNYTVTSSFSLPPTPVVIQKQETPPEQIINEVCEAMQVASVLLKTKCRSRHVVQARWLVWKILYSWGYSAEKCGEFFGSDHTTVFNCLSKVDADISNMPHLQFAWNRVKSHFIEGRSPQRSKPV